MTGQFIGYFPQWAIYERKAYLRNIHDNGTADRLTILNYAFENLTTEAGTIDPDKYPEKYPGWAAFEAIRPVDRSASPAADGAINSGDAGADYLWPFTKDQTISGKADPGWGAQVLMGNFNQLRQLRDKHPQLKVCVSMGGWVYSRNWSDAVKTPELRTKLVSSVIDLFIKGNLAKKIWVYRDGKMGQEDNFGGPEVAKGIFDGVDLDWEWPGGDFGLPGNHYDKADKANLVELLKEFRRQLDDEKLLRDYPPRGGKYLLTAFLPADPDVIAAGWDAPKVMDCLDLGHIQGYDFHGPFEGTPFTTNHQAALHPTGRGTIHPDWSVETAVAAWVKAAGEKYRNKFTIGVPYYGRGWKGVRSDEEHGLYQSSGGAVDVNKDVPYLAQFEDGVNDFRRLATLDDKDFPVYRDDKNVFAWRYSTDKKILWTYDDARTAHAKAEWAVSQKLAGVMAYSLDGDQTKDNVGVLSAAIRAGLDGEALPDAADAAVPGQRKKPAPSPTRVRR